MENIDELTYSIIGAAMEVHRTLGPGFLESLYRNALIHELRTRQIATKAEVDVQIDYKGTPIGRHRLDILVRDEVIIELKAISAIAQIHVAQILSYMKATGTETGLIINFGEESLDWKRLTRKPPITRI